jgi:hypothetical protein
MKRDNVDRHAVPEDRLERFMGLVYSLVEPFGVHEVPEVMHYVELLGQAIERQIVESKFSGTSQNRTVADRKKFILIFKNRYLHLTDLEYSRAITGIEGKLMNQVIKIMMDNGFEVDEYLTWVFDEFLPENQKFCPPTIKLICSGFIVEKFLYENKEKIKQRKEALIMKKASLDLISRARVLIRIFVNNEDVKKSIVNVLTGYKDGSIMLEKMREVIEALERVAREAPEAQEAKGQTEGVGDGTG